MTGRSIGISVRNFVSFFLSALVLALLFANSSAAQVKAPQTAGVDNTKMGPYRALATLAFNFSQKGDNATAATLAKILDEADKAMDQFVSLLADHPTSAPDPARLRAAYTNYLDKLKAAD